MRQRVELVGIVEARPISARLEISALEGAIDWSLSVALDGEITALSLAGVATAPLLPGPARARIAYVDAPAEISVEGRRGGLTNGGRDIFLDVTQVAEGALIRASVELEWFALEHGGGSRSVTLDLCVLAEVVVAGR